MIGPRVSKQIVEEFARENNSEIYQVAQKSNLYYEENSMTALLGYNILFKRPQRSFHELPEGEFKSILKEVPFGRMQNVKDGNVSFTIDVGHNPDGVLRTLEAVLAQVGTEPSSEQALWCIYGSSKKKNTKDSLEFLASKCQKVFLVSASHDRAKPIEEIQKEIQSSSMSAESKGKLEIVGNGKIRETLEHVKRESQKCKGTQHVLCLGSFFNVEELNNSLKFIPNHFNTPDWESFNEINYPEIPKGLKH